MHVHNGAVMFWNHERTLKLVLRNDPVDEDTIGWDLSIVCSDEDGDEGLAEALRLEFDGYFDDGGLFVLDSDTLPLESKPEDDGVKKAARAVNAAYETALCACGAYLITDGARVCMFCQMTATPENTRQEYCPICMEHGAARYMTTQRCCGQKLHRACVAAWNRPTCPLCRADAATTAV